MVAGGQEQPLPGQFGEQLRASLHNHYMNIALNPDNFTAIYQGDVEYDGVTAAKLYFPEAEITYFLDVETALPLKYDTKTFNPQVGAEVTVENVYSDWTESEGIKVAYSEMSKADGQTQASIKYSAHSVE
jgi:hypothetical protein